MYQSRSFTTIVGEAVYPRLNTPDRTFGPAGVYHTGVRLTRLAQNDLEAACALAFRAAHPWHTGPITMPIRTDPSGRRYALAKSTSPPKLPPAFRQDWLKDGDMLELRVRLWPYLKPERSGVALYLHQISVLHAHGTAA